MSVQKLREYLDQNGIVQVSGYIHKTFTAKRLKPEFFRTPKEDITDDMYDSFEVYPTIILEEYCEAMGRSGSNIIGGKTMSGDEYAEALLNSMTAPVVPLEFNDSKRKDVIEDLF